MSDMVERVGRAIATVMAQYTNWEEFSPSERAERQDLAARAAIEAMRLPTRNMHDAGEVVMIESETTCNATDIWQSMVDAALARSPDG